MKTTLLSIVKDSFRTEVVKPITDLLIEKDQLIRNLTQFGLDNIHTPNVDVIQKCVEDII